MDYGRVVLSRVRRGGHLAGQAPGWVPVALTTTTAALNVYSIAVGLDCRIATMAKLHTAWNAIAHDYEHLWNHTYAADAEDEVARNHLGREKEPSELATTDALLTT